MGARRDESDFAPVRWAAAGFLGGASLIGLLWAILGRAPALPPNPVPTRVEQARIAERVTPRTPPPRATPPAEERTAGTSSTTDEFEDESRAPGFDGVDMVKPESTPGASSEAAIPDPPRTPMAGDRLNINTATAAELELLPRIGPTLAARIIEFRDREGRIRSLSHLMEVRGIGARTVEQLEAYIRFE